MGRTFAFSPMKKGAGGFYGGSSWGGATAGRLLILDVEKPQVLGFCKLPPLVGFADLGA